MKDYHSAYRTLGDESPSGRVRYFKATDGRITAFRKSTGIEYRAMRITEDRIRFLTEPPNPDACNEYPVREIYRSEYLFLAAIKKARVADLRARGIIKRWEGQTPSDSWVTNADIIRAFERS